MRLPVNFRGGIARSQHLRDFDMLSGLSKITGSRTDGRVAAAYYPAIYAKHGR
jgi:hypothetical protein